MKIIVRLAEPKNASEQDFCTEADIGEDNQARVNIFGTEYVIDLKKKDTQQKSE